MDTNRVRDLERYPAEQADRPFGDTDSASGRTLRPFSEAGQEAASNLLTKAVRALDHADVQKANAYVDRAVALPFDRHEEAHPAAVAVQMMLFNLVSDAVENSTSDDSRWLEAAIAALATADSVGRGELRETLSDVADEYELSRSERATIRAVLGDIPEGIDLWDLQVEPGVLAGVVMSVLETCRAYGTALEADPS